MKKLLKQWAELEPTRCKVNGDNIILMRFIGGSNSYQETSLNESLVRDDVFCATIEAIEAHGWLIDLKSKRGSGYVCGVEYVLHKTVYAHSAIPAHALLSAHIKALKALDAQEGDFTG